MRQETTDLLFLPEIPPYVDDILRRLEDAGHESYAVGGCVRDTLLGRRPHDWDVATSAGAAAVTALFERTAPTGIKYGTVTVLTDAGGVEVTTFRRDGEYRDGRRPETVDFTGGITDDLSRRDFTINAMAMDRSGRITDPFEGREDLSGCVIRCVGDPERRFSEDALRMLRAVRFSAQLGFEIEAGTLGAIIRLSPLARRLSAERVRDELVKLLKSERPEYVERLMEYGLLDGFLTGRGGGIPFERLRAVPADDRLEVFALLAAKAGAAADPAELLRALRCPARLASAVSDALGLMEELRPYAMSVRLALCAHQTPAVLAAAGAGGFWESAAREVSAGGFTRISDLAIGGRELHALGLSGPEIGAALRALALRVTSGQLENSPAALLSAAAQTKIP